MYPLPEHVSQVWLWRSNPPQSFPALIRTSSETQNKNFSSALCSFGLSGSLAAFEVKVWNQADLNGFYFHEADIYSFHVLKIMFVYKHCIFWVTQCLVSIYFVAKYVKIQIHYWRLNQKFRTPMLVAPLNKFPDVFFNHISVFCELWVFSLKRGNNSNFTTMFPLNDPLKMNLSV